MGQGQEVIARRHVAAAAAEGCWVLLQNAHLGLGYLTEVRLLWALGWWCECRGGWGWGGGVGRGKGSLQGSGESRVGARAHQIHQE